VARKSEQAARIEAVAARDAESLALSRETEAKKEAVKNLRSALDSVDTWLLQLSGDLEFYPGLAYKRTEFLESASEYYARLSQSKSTDADLKFETARAAIRGGDTSQLLGRFDEAVPLFDHAINCFRTRFASNPNDTESQKELANALIGRAIAATRDNDSLADLSMKTCRAAMRIVFMPSIGTTERDSKVIRFDPERTFKFHNYRQRSFRSMGFRDTPSRMWMVVRRVDVGCGPGAVAVLT